VLGMNEHEHDFEDHVWTHRHASDGTHDHPVKSTVQVGEIEIIRLDAPPELTEDGRPALTFLRVDW